MRLRREFGLLSLHGSVTVVPSYFSGRFKVNPFVGVLEVTHLKQISYDLERLRSQLRGQFSHLNYLGQEDESVGIVGLVFNSSSGDFWRSWWPSRKSGLSWRCSTRFGRAHI